MRQFTVKQGFVGSALLERVCLGLRPHQQAPKLEEARVEMKGRERWRARHNQAKQQTMKWNSEN
jgi:hypothetical protein